MASGRHDYWYGMLPGKAALSVNQTEWFVWGFGIVAAGYSSFLIDYTVTANYKLNIVGGLVSCRKPGVNIFKLYIDDDVVWQIYFDQTVTLPFNVSSSHILVSGQRIRVYIANIEEMDITFSTTLFGFEEYLVGM